MKKVHVIFATAAVLLSIAGVFANALFTTVYYRAANANFNTPGPDCSVLISNPCVDNGCGVQCSGNYSTQLPNEEEPTTKIYFKSKIRKIEGVPQPCEIVCHQVN